MTKKTSRLAQRILIWFPSPARCTFVFSSPVQNFIWFLSTKNWKENGKNVSNQIILLCILYIFTIPDNVRQYSTTLYGVWNSVNLYDGSCFKTKVVWYRRLVLPRVKRAYRYLWFTDCIELVGFTTRNFQFQSCEVQKTYLCKKWILLLSV